MNIHEIENMTFAELKANRAELIDAIKKTPPEDLARRYLQARTDAKQRDEKLAEQGKTIVALQDGNAALSEKVASIEAQLASSKLAIENYTRELEAARVAHSDEMAVLNEKRNELSGMLSEEKERAARLKVQAEKYMSAVSSIHSVALDAINSQVIDDAETGE